MAELTADEKRKELREYCAGRNCNYCKLESFCFRKELHPVYSPDVSNYEISKIYSKFEKLKGEPIMNEHETQTTLEATTDGTIAITRAEYAYLIAKSAKIDLLEDYVNNREYLDKDTVHAILGMLGSEESEG